MFCSFKNSEITQRLAKRMTDHKKIQVIYLKVDFHFKIVINRENVNNLPVLECRTFLDVLSVR